MPVKKVENPIMDHMGIKRAKKTEFGPNASARAQYIPDGDGGWREASPEEYAEHKRAVEEERLEQVLDEWQAEMTPRGIVFAGTLPTKVSGKCRLKCGCDRAKTFEVTLGQIAQLKWEDPRCPRCGEFERAEKFTKIVEERGGTLKTPYKEAKTPVRIECENGHEFESRPDNVQAGSWCPDCYKGSGERKLREVLAERGCRLTDYGKYASTQKKWLVDFHGYPIGTDHSTLLDSPPIHGPRGPQRVRVFYDDLGEFYYVLAGEVPPVLPKRIAEIVNNGDWEDAGTAKNRADVRRAVTLSIDEERILSPDYRCLNVLWNDDWQAPGKYRWGEIEPFDGTLVYTNTMEPVKF